MKIIAIVFIIFINLLSIVKAEEKQKSYLLDIRISELYNKDKRDEYNKNICFTVQAQILKSETNKALIEFLAEVSTTN